MHEASPHLTTTLYSNTHPKVLCSIFDQFANKSPEILLEMANKFVIFVIFATNKRQINFWLEDSDKNEETRETTENSKIVA